MNSLQVCGAKPSEGCIRETVNGEQKLREPRIDDIEKLIQNVNTHRKQCALDRGYNLKYGGRKPKHSLDLALMRFNEKPKPNCFTRVQFKVSEATRSAFTWQLGFLNGWNPVRSYEAVVLKPKV